jgi:hypothetical protein
LSEKPTPWSEILTAISGVLTVVANYLGTQPLTTLFALLLGSTLTYTVQKRLQRETEKRSKNIEYVEQYYGPLLLEIQKIQEKVLTDFIGNYSLGNLIGFKTQPQFYTMGKKFRADFLSFIDEIDKLARNIQFYRRSINKKVNEEGNTYIVTEFGKNVTLNYDPHNSSIILIYTHEGETSHASLVDCIIQDKSPIEIISENVSNFLQEDLQVSFNLLDTKNNTQKYDRKSYAERRVILDKILLEIQAELNQDQSYKGFKRECENLREKAESISSRLTKYVEEYVSIVDI